jgi:TolB protein
MRVLQSPSCRRSIGVGTIVAVFVLSVLFAVSSGAVEVFIDAARGSIQKIPIAVFPFKQGFYLNGQAPAEVLKADLRRSLLFDVADLEKLGIKGEVNSQPDGEAIRKAGEAGLAVQVWGSILSREQEVLMEGTLFDFTRGEVVGGKRYVGSPAVVRPIAWPMSWSFTTPASRESPAAGSLLCRRETAPKNSS